MTPLVARWATIVGIFTVLLSLIALVLAIVVRGGVPANSQTVTSLISFIGLLVSLGMSLLQGMATAQALNGHLQAHVDKARAEGQEQAQQ